MNFQTKFLNDYGFVLPTKVQEKANSWIDVIEKTSEFCQSLYEDREKMAQWGNDLQAKVDRLQEMVNILWLSSGAPLPDDLDKHEILFSKH